MTVSLLLPVLHPESSSPPAGPGKNCFISNCWCFPSNDNAQLPQASTIGQESESCYQSGVNCAPFACTFTSFHPFFFRVTYKMDPLIGTPAAEKDRGCKNNRAHHLCTRIKQLEKWTAILSYLSSKRSQSPFQTLTNWPSPQPNRMRSKHTSFHPPLKCSQRLVTAWPWMILVVHTSPDGTGIEARNYRRNEKFRCGLIKILFLLGFNGHSYPGYNVCFRI